MKIILLGAPGSGKGTVAKKIQKNLDIPIISTGVILREAIEKHNALGMKVKSIIAQGELVPDNLIMKIIKERVIQEDCKNGYIFDGFPRNIQQAHSLEKLNIELSSNIDFVFYFKIPFSEIIQRLSSRRVCRKCGFNYNLSFNPPKKENICDLCQGNLYQREDDKEETIKNRLQVYNNQTMPLKQYYAKKGILIPIDAHLSDNAFKEIMKRISNRDK